MQKKFFSPLFGQQYMRRGNNFFATILKGNVEIAFIGIIAAVFSHKFLGQCIIPKR